MNLNYSVLFFCWNLYYLLLSGSGIESMPTEIGTLVLVQVLFRHGNRTPNGPEELYPKDPYLNETYFPFGLGQLTNSGKRREYGIGRDLRDRYHNFLGPYYIPEIVEPRTTDYNRTKMSIELVLASLFPPYKEQWWNSQRLYWQPVPYNYLPRSQDKVLLGTLCPNYVKLYNAYTQSPKLQAEFNENKKTFDYISKNSGKKFTTYQDVYNLYFGLKAEEDYGLKLPEWTREVWPKTITELATREYSVATGTTDLRRMASGYFLQDLITNINSKIDGTNAKKKLYLNSAHEDNIADLLTTLGIFEPPRIPNYGAYVIFEAHRINGKYGIKIYYENYVESKLQLLKLPACESFCPIEQFISLTEEYIPTADLCNL